MADSRTILKMVKTLLRNRLGEVNLSHLMKIAIESPQILLEEELKAKKKNCCLVLISICCSDLLMI